MNRSFDAFILAGGNSSRMGFDKAALTLGGVAVIERIADALSGVAGEIFVAGGSGEIGGLKRVPDLARPGSPRSSLSGLYSALSHASSDWIAVAACDMPFLTRGLFEALSSRRNLDDDAVIPRDRSGSAQPLCGFYRVRSCVEACRCALESDDLSLRGMLLAVETRWVDFDEYAHLPNAENFFFNLNTPEDIASAEMIMAGISGQ